MGNEMMGSARCHPSEAAGRGAECSQAVLIRLIQDRTWRREGVGCWIREEVLKVPSS